MNKNILIFFLVLLIIDRVNAQEAQRISFNHQLTLKKMEPLKRSLFSTAAPETSVRILAVMIAFKEDNDPLTSGNGSFDISKPSKPYLGAPPHNKEYFQKHITFLENYFRKSSNGKLKVTGTVLDSIFRLPNEMGYYSPPLRDEKNVELGSLVKDSWQLVDSLTKLWGDSIPYDQYDAFLIFHAGVGRDINLSSLYGYTPTPNDIPSLYLNLSGMKEIFGQAFEGIIINEGRDTIKNSMILPETEAIEGYHFGINGLLAAIVGSHLGLPDLFDTKNPGEGRSGIGRFGLMDGESIFSWFGAFPPEPSAWEKYFLGWIQPITIASSDSIYNFPAVSLNNSVDTVYKVLINAKEYFLVENRNRDANRDSARVTMFYNGSEEVHIWAHDTTGFNEDNQDALYGVITDVDEFDWSLPGGYDSKKNILYDGGILIWHIDENIIDANLAANTINADPNRRGVNLMEADGAQDIGQIYDWLAPWKYSSSGWLFDFWYKGNQAPLRKYDTTGFTPKSYPSSMSNDGANSHIYINNFSERSPRMNARIKVGDEQVKPLTGFPKSVKQTFDARSIKYITPTWVCIDSGTCPSGLVINTSGHYVRAISPDVQPVVVGPPQIYGWSFTGAPIFETGDLSGLMVQYGNIFPQKSPAFSIALSNINNDNYFDFSVGGFQTYSPLSQPIVYTWSASDLDKNSIADLIFNKNMTLPIMTHAVVSDSFTAYGASHGFVYFIKNNGFTLDSVQIDRSDTTDIVGLSLLDKQSSYYIAISSRGTVRIVSPFMEEFTPRVKDFSKQMVSSPVSATISVSLGKRIAFASKDGTVFLVGDRLNIANGFPFYTGNEIFNSPAIADIDGDGQKDIIVFSGNKIFAINTSGAVVDNFPVTVPSTKPLLTSPIIADIDGDGSVDIVAVTQEGLVVAYDKSGRMANGFPLLAGVNGGSTPAAFYIPISSDSVGIGLAVASDDGHVYAWITGILKTNMSSLPIQPWPQYMHDAQNTGLDETILQIKLKSNEFLPVSLAYNWPNPVTREDGFKTYIRCYLSDNAKVKINIFDAAGDLVTDFGGKNFEVSNNENGSDIDIVDWDVSNIQSGIYYAHIQAEGSGKSGYAIIKIAVVR
ncbi:MAG: hypothetical protein QME52_06870 [Bacteroidota bacterium]|nr:hypothetical protein [Bacteroidota bacterium]